MDHRRLCRRLTHASSSPMPSTRSAARAMRGSVDQRRALTWHGGSQHDTTAEVSASSRGPARHTDAKSTTSILPDQQRSRSTSIPREQQIGITSIFVPVTNKDGRRLRHVERQGVCGGVPKPSVRAAFCSSSSSSAHLPTRLSLESLENAGQIPATIVRLTACPRRGRRRRSPNAPRCSRGPSPPADPPRPSCPHDKSRAQLRKQVPYDSRRPGPNESGERFVGRCAKAFGAGENIGSAPLPAAVAPADKPTAVPGERPLRVGRVVGAHVQAVHRFRLGRRELLTRKETTAEREFVSASVCVRETDNRTSQRVAMNQELPPQKCSADPHEQNHLIHLPSIYQL